MDSRKKKTLILNTLTLILCVFIIGLFCIKPKKEETHVLDRYKVVFDTAGGNYIDAIEIEEGGSATEPNIPTRDGYEFVGWMLGDELYDFSQEVSGDITLRAEWRELDPEKNYYTIEFNSDGGSTVGRLILEEGSIPTEPIAPTKDGFEFVGWYKDGVLFDFTIPITENVSLVAQWVATEDENPDVDEDNTKTYTVRFNLNGGNGSVASQKVKAGETARNPGSPTRDGYSFDGWRLNSGTGVQYNFNTPVNSNITLYASWVARTYTVRFLNENGAILPNGTYNVNAGASITNPPVAPAKNFYNFVGYYSAVNGGVNLNSVTINQSMDFYARYQKADVTVSCESRTNVQGMNSDTCVVKISGGTIPSTACVMHKSGCIGNGQEMAYNPFYNNISNNPKVYEAAGSENYVEARLVR